MLFSALGTTLKDVGSKELQYIVDYQYEFAKFAAKNKVSFTYWFHCVTTINHCFYPKLKENSRGTKNYVKKIQIQRWFSQTRRFD